MTDLPSGLAWDGIDLEALFRLEPSGPGRFRNRVHDGNLNGRGRVFGGQMIAQALVAAAHTVDRRVPTCLQLLFLKGADIRQPIDYTVTPLQDGKRFSSRHVRGTQGEAAVIDAHVSFQVSGQEGWIHETPAEAAPPPESLLSMTELDRLHRQRLEDIGYTLFERPCFEFKLADADRFLFEPHPSPRQRWWIRLKRKLPEEPILHAAALAYLSDWWTNAPIVTPHQAIAGARDHIYLASLNHSLWLHRFAPVDGWLLFVVESPYAGSGRGLAVGQIYNGTSQMIASVAQECTISINQDRNTYSAIR